MTITKYRKYTTFLQNIGKYRNVNKIQENSGITRKIQGIMTTDIMLGV